MKTEEKIKKARSIEVPDTELIFVIQGNSHLKEINELLS